VKQSEHSKQVAFKLTAILQADAYALQTISQDDKRHVIL